MRNLTDHLPIDPYTTTNLTLPLTAATEGIEVRMQLARGTVLQHGDILATEEILQAVTPYRKICAIAVLNPGSKGEVSKSPLSSVVTRCSCASVRR
jgi:urease accessory protein UreE